MNAVISGRAGRALLLDGDSLRSFDAADPTNIVPRKVSELAYLFGEARDLRVIENTDVESVERELNFDCTLNSALDLTLISLDAELADEIRSEALVELEVLLVDRRIVARLENILYARPLPEDGDLERAAKLCDQTLSRSLVFVQTLAEQQQLITAVSEAWDAIPTKYFGGYEQRQEFHGVAAREGLFRGFVSNLAAGESIDSLVFSAIHRISVQSLPNFEKILAQWTMPFLKTPSSAGRELEKYEKSFTFLTGSGRPLTIPDPLSPVWGDSADELPLLEKITTAGKALRILFVGSSFLAIPVERRLVASGKMVDQVATGAEAISLSSLGLHTVVVCETKLPDMSGIDLMRHLKVSNPQTEIIAITGYGSAEEANQLRDYASSVLAQPFDLSELESLITEAFERVERRGLVTSRLRPRMFGVAARALMSASSEPRQKFGMVGASKEMQTVFRAIESAARSDANVLIVGEPGTGKSLIAQAIHDHSQRSGKPFVSVDVSHILPYWIESQIFGHMRGALSGAVYDHAGLIQQAASGSLLFEEIAGIPPELQAKLLRLLEERAYQRLGSQKTEQADFRLISSTNTQPDLEIAAGRLRADLFFRISTITIDVPPLRERRLDIQPLAEHFLRVFSQKLTRPKFGLSAAALQLLVSYSWPGNVRELENVIERAGALTRGDMIEAEDLGFGDTLVFSRTASGTSSRSRNPGLAEVEREMIEAALKRTGGNQQAAANLLGIVRPTLNRKIKKYNIDIKSLL